MNKERSSKSKGKKNFINREFKDRNRFSKE